MKRHVSRAHIDEVQKLIDRAEAAETEVESLRMALQAAEHNRLAGNQELINQRDAALARVAALEAGVDVKIECWNCSNVREGMWECDSCDFCSKFLQAEEERNAARAEIERLKLEAQNLWDDSILPRIDEVEAERDAALARVEELEATRDANQATIVSLTIERNAARAEAQMWKRFQGETAASEFRQENAALHMLLGWIRHRASQEVADRIDAILKEKP